MECAMVNFTNPGDRVLVINGGKFGHRWQQLAETYGCQTHTIEVEWGQAPELSDIQHLLELKPEWSAVFLQANETSTGIAYPLETWVPGIRSITDALIVVDAITGLCAHRIDMDKWGIDVAVGGAQKGFGIDPGLSFIAVSEKARSRLSERPKYYFDLAKEMAGQESGQSSWTPATGLISSLDKALELLSEIGLEKTHAHHDLMGEVVRTGGLAMGLDLLANQYPSSALTAFKLPPSIDGKLLTKHLQQRWGTTFAGGQGKLAGKIIRFSHLGFTDPLDILAGLAALEMSLRHFGHRCTVGSSVAAAMKILAKHTS